MENRLEDSKTNAKLTLITGRRHSFIKGKSLHIRILDYSGEPIKKTLCQVTYSSGIQKKATTDNNGWLTVAVSGKQEYANLVLEGVAEDNERKVYLNFPSIYEEEGVKQRLSNLGFTVEPDLAQGVLDFQDHYDLPLTGEIDDDFKRGLEDIYNKFRDEEKEEYMDTDFDDDDFVDENEGRT